MPVRPGVVSSFFFPGHSCRSGGPFLLMQTCGSGIRTREGVLVSTIIRVSSRRMSFINARGKLQPYTCIYTRIGRREIERQERSWGEMTRKVERKSEARGTRREKTTEAKYPSFCFVPGGWAPLPPRPLARSSYYYYFLSQYLLFPHSVLC